MLPWDKRSSLLASLWSLIGSGKKSHHLWRAIHSVNSFPETKHIAVGKASTLSFVYFTSKYFQALLPPASPSKILPTFNRYELLSLGTLTAWITIHSHRFTKWAHKWRWSWNGFLPMQSRASQSLALHLCAVLTPALHLPQEPNQGMLATLDSLPPSICLVYHFLNSYTYSWAQAFLWSAPHQSPSSLLF